MCCAATAKAYAIAVKSSKWYNFRWGFTVPISIPQGSDSLYAIRLKILLIVLCIMPVFTHACADCPMLVAAGGSFGIARSADGVLWGWGDNAKGQLGNGTTQRVRTPQACALGLDAAQVQSIACGNIATLFLMENGDVYTCGANNYGQQGIRSRESVVKTPVRIPELSNITQIACGFGQCLALDRDGKVFAWGRNSNGQIGDGTRQNRSGPVALPLEHIISVQCGGKYCMAMAEDGTVYGWGDNEYGQLLDASRYRNVLEPAVLSISGRFRQIACGGDTAFGIDEEGTLWAWGRNDFLQLGNTGVQGKTQVPVPVTFPQDQVKIDSVFAYNAHTAALSSSGGLWQWGSVYHGQIGNGMIRSKSIPVEACPSEGVFTAAVGSLQSYVVLQDGSLLACGCNEYSQTGAFKKRTDYYVRDWKDTGLNLKNGQWSDPHND